MYKILVGLTISIFGTVLGFSMGHGRLSSLWHPPGMLVVLSFIVGGLSMSHGVSDASAMIRGALNLGSNLTQARLETNLRICEAGTRFAFCGGIVASIMGVIITMSSLGGDVSQVGAFMAASFCGLLWAVAIVGMVFQPLKFKFLQQLHETDEKRRDDDMQQNRNEKELS